MIDLILTVLAFLLSIVLLLARLDPRTFPLLLGLLVVLLGLAIVMRILQLRRGKEGPEAKEMPARKEPERVAPAVAPTSEALVETGVVQFLARLQEKGRLVDFLLDDIAPYSNEQVGAAARVVHQGCREVLKSAFDIEPVHRGQEREAVTLAGDFDAGAYRLVGKVPEHAPYKGTVLHRGWKATRISLPRVAESARDSAARKVIAPAEVEVG